MNNNCTLLTRLRCLTALGSVLVCAHAAISARQEATTSSLMQAVSAEQDPLANVSLDLTAQQRDALDQHINALSASMAKHKPISLARVDAPKSANVPKTTSTTEEKAATKNAATVQKESAQQPVESHVNAGVPKAATAQEEESGIEFHFENADLQNLITQIEDIYGIKFITDDSIYPKRADGKGVQGSKISFKTQVPLSKKEAWNLFIGFLDSAGLSVVPEADPTFYRITSTALAKKSPIPAFIGVDSEKLPDSDQMIRYVYFLENMSPAPISLIIDPLRSPASSLTQLNDLKAFLLIEKSYNVKALMKIVKELDRVSMPQAMSVLKLQKTDVNKVADLYKNIIGDEKSGSFWGARKQPSTLFFPEGIRVIPEPRTNALILLGPQDAIKKIEEFIVQHIDIDLEIPYSPLRIYQLKYAQATNIANIMNEVTKFNTDTPAGTYGGLRGNDKFLRPITFTADTATNRIIVRGYEEDYLKAKAILDKLDEPQPQVAIEVLILSVALDETKMLGAQLRKKFPFGTAGLLGDNVNWQTSGLFGDKGIVENSTTNNGSQRLFGNLLNLVTGASAGNTIVSLGKDMFNVWGVLQALESVSQLNVVSNPFLVATNNTNAEVKLGQTRRVVSSIIFGANQSNAGTNSFADKSANLQVTVVPYINSDGMITLNLNIQLDEFVNATNASDATTTNKTITTKTIVANKEVLALGGLVRNRRIEKVSQTPLLGTIPGLGWLFKNKSKQDTKENLLILVSTNIIDPFAPTVSDFTKVRIADYKTDVAAFTRPDEKFDPINRWFFGSGKQGSDRIINKSYFKRKKAKVKKGDRDMYRETMAKRQDAHQAKLLAQKNTQPAAPETPTSIVATNAQLPVGDQKKTRKKASLSDFFTSDTRQGERA